MEDSTWTRAPTKRPSQIFLIGWLSLPERQLQSSPPPPSEAWATPAGDAIPPSCTGVRCGGSAWAPTYAHALRWSQSYVPWSIRASG
jgi:hypothetical protein